MKKWSSTPATQAELRDCSVSLSEDDQKLVTASHKVCGVRCVVDCVGCMMYLLCAVLHEFQLITAEVSVTERLNCPSI